MFDVNIGYKEIKISSIEKEDVNDIYKWCNKENVFIEGRENVLELKELYERFLEYYVSECEIFLKILKNDKLIGIFRGRAEFKNPNLLWISCFTLESKYLKTDKAKEILNNILSYFSNNFGINNFLFGVPFEDKEILNILKDSGFEVERISNDFFIGKEKKSNTIILKKEKFYEA